MKAWMFRGAGAGMELVDIPDPVAEGDFVVLDVMAAGMCHSDLHILEGPGEAWLDAIPTVLGHEVAGLISAIDHPIPGFAVGDRVAVGPGPGRCGGWVPPIVRHRQRECDRTVSSPFVPGLTTFGGYAQKCRVHASKLVPIPEGLPFSVAAVATDAILTAYHAVVETAGVGPDSVVVIVGLGGLGLNGLRIAALTGAKVHAVDLNEALFPEALGLGASSCSTSLDKLQALLPDVIIDFVGLESTIRQSLATACVGGRVILVGLADPAATIDTYSFVTSQVTFEASLGGNMASQRGVFELLASGAVQPPVEEVPFERILDGFEKLRLGTANGRLFTRPNAPPENKLSDLPSD